MTSMSHRAAVLALLLFATAALAQQQPKNVILLIGDGMGPAHFTAARMRRGADFQIGRMKILGLVTTHSADRAVTDSAAAATALATGTKTNNEMVSVDPLGARLTTALENAEKAGKATGVVTTANFFDATPAAFAAHAAQRGNSLDIVKQMVASGAEISAGGGAASFGKDALPPIGEVITGVQLVTTRAELDAANGPRIVAVFPSQPRDVDVPDAPLPHLTRWALDRLSKRPAGFFLLVEHEGTDSSSHQNNVADLNASLTSFDTTVGVALDFAAKDGNTLVLVTGDHETGALRISESRSGRLRLEWASTDHTGTAVPIFAFGPGAVEFAGIQDNTDVGKKLLALTAPAR